MRIISGQFRGKEIVAPASLPVRPTTDFAKTGLFNRLETLYNFKTLNVLDLYSGTGSLTYEFISRGCENIIAVDQDAGCVKFIRDTLIKLKAEKCCTVIRSSAANFLAHAEQTFDIIIADPPFSETPAEELILLISEKKLLKESGIFILEHQSAQTLNHLPGFDTLRKYGNVSFSFYKAFN